MNEHGGSGSKIAQQTVIYFDRSPTLLQLTTKSTT